MICAIVVTHNRKHYLKNCLEAILKGTRVPEKILVVDNASTDQTKELIEDIFADELAGALIEYRLMPENVGGAGGFYNGLSCMLNSVYDFFWLMDDDAEPDINALYYLTDYVGKTENNHRKCFVSLAIDRERTELCWGIGILNDYKTEIFEYLKDIPRDRVLKAPSAPFLGFLISRWIVEQVGLPRGDYFIWGDDTEYSSRIWRMGYEIHYVRDSIIYHPVVEKVSTTFLGRKVVLLNADDWKQYYGMRNDVYTLSRQKSFLTMLKRIVFYFLVWKARGMQPASLHYYLKGLYHGLIGRLGRYPG
jgi:rhamnopyranosyl-N-acetylglucosaminyl-diphospho-decaprenol beta-1,3/1,4-galactofuranosyltransferase